MSVIARFTVPADQFALGAVLEVREGIQIRLESMIPTSSATIPYFWVPTVDADDVEAALRRAPIVEDVQIVDQVGSETLFRVEWSSEVNGLIGNIRDSHAVLLEAEGLGDNWSFRMRFRNREELSRFYRRCVDHGVTPHLDEVNNPFGSTEGNEFGITERQREALLTALESGYFSVPRKITLEQLAEKLGISDTAYSQRLRRGLTALLSSALYRPTADAQPERED